MQKHKKKAAGWQPYISSIQEVLIQFYQSYYFPVFTLHHFCKEASTHVLVSICNGRIPFQVSHFFNHSSQYIVNANLNNFGTLTFYKQFKLSCGGLGATLTLNGRASSTTIESTGVGAAK